MTQLYKEKKMKEKDVETKIKEFDKVFLEKCEEVDNKILEIWNEIISEDKKEIIYKIGDEYEVRLDKVWLNALKMYYADSDGVLQFINIDNQENLHFIQISDDENSHFLQYYISMSGRDETSNEDMLDPITDSEYEFGIDVTTEEIINRKMAFLQAKVIFLEYSKKHGKEIFDKYYELVDEKMNRQVKYIENAMNDVKNIEV